MLALLLTVTLQDPEFTRAESLLAARDLERALAVAQRRVERHPRDPRTFLLLGRIHYARPVIGRYAALEAFRTAARLAPRDPEPLYRQAEVGFYLGSDDGEWIAREALLKLLALVPDYRDSWQRFGRLFRNDEIAQRAEEALARHGDHPVALERRAELALLRGDYTGADSLLALVLARRRFHVPAYLLRARLHFEAGRDASGHLWYDSAVAYADLDSTGVLWDAVWMIATPDEVERHAATSPGDGARFFEWFWGKRDANLVTPENERIAEHFRRLAEARRQFPLLHPLNLFHRSAAYRALAAGGAARLPDATGDGSTAYARAGLDARGLLWVRHGRPDQRHYRVFEPLRPTEIATISPHDLESWLYHTPAGPLTIALARGSAGMQGGQFGGDFIFLPVSGRQARSTRVLLATDRTSHPATLQARVWSATFTGQTPAVTDVYFKSHPDTAAVALWDTAGDQVARDVGPGLLALAAPPGRYRLGVDVDSADALGRVRGDLEVPRYAPVTLALSSLVLAPADSVLGRLAVLEAMPADLVYPARSPLACYAEVYGLSADRAGRARYAVRYSFEPRVGLPARLLGRADAVVFEFSREVPAAPLVPERLVLDPGRVPPGRYRVTLAVTDLRRNVKSASVALDITLR